MALIFNVVSFTLVAIGSLLSGLILGAVMGLVMAGIAAYYAFSVWGRVPVRYLFFELGQFVRTRQLEAHKNLSRTVLPRSSLRHPTWLPPSRPCRPIWG
jgi:uncharacterized membrane protein